MWLLNVAAMAYGDGARGMLVECIRAIGIGTGTAGQVVERGMCRYMLADRQQATRGWTAPWLVDRDAPTPASHTHTVARTAHTIAHDRTRSHTIAHDRILTRSHICCSPHITSTGRDATRSTPPFPNQFNSTTICRPLPSPRSARMSRQPFHHQMCIVSVWHRHWCWVECVAHLSGLSSGTETFTYFVTLCGPGSAWHPSCWPKTTSASRHASHQVAKEVVVAAAAAAVVAAATVMVPQGSLEVESP